MKKKYMATFVTLGIAAALVIGNAAFISKAFTNNQPDILTEQPEGKKMIWEQQKQARRKL